MKSLVWRAGLTLGILVFGFIAQAGDRHDSAVLLVDVSSTVSDRNLVPEARKIAQDMNAKFPDYVQSGGLLTFGNLHPSQNNWLGPVQDYQRAVLDGAIAKISEGKGSTPIGSALGASKEGLEKAKGKKALILISDGLDTGSSGGGSDPVQQAKKLKAAYGDNLCIFTIQLGDKPQGGALLEAIRQAGGCGTATKAASLKSDAEVQGLVDIIFPPSVRIPVAEQAKPVQKPVEKIVTVVKQEEKDSDGDGVPDSSDQCPGTPKGVKVDARGCWVLTDVRFASGSSQILTKYYPKLDEAVAVLKANADVRILIEGYTDSQGSEASNLALSQKRAKSVMDYLVRKGIAADRLSAQGKGASQPIADNATPEGRALNRRIELKANE